MDNTASNNKHTSDYTTYGSLLIGFGVLPVIYALGEKNTVSLIAGSAFILLGTVLVIIGKLKHKRMFLPDTDGNVK